MNKRWEGKLLSLLKGARRNGHPRGSGVSGTLDALLGDLPGWAFSIFEKAGAKSGERSGQVTGKCLLAMVSISIDAGDSELACVVNQFLDRPHDRIAWPRLAFGGSGRTADSSPAHQPNPPPKRN
jgi:hypothetical protein